MYFTICLCALHTLACILDLSLICRPISAQWNSDINATCGDQRLSFIILESTAIILDLVILIAPVYVVWKLRLPRKKRLALCLVFELGAMSVLFPCFIHPSPKFVGLLPMLSSKPYPSREAYQLQSFHHRRLTLESDILRHLSGLHLLQKLLWSLVYTGCYDQCHHLRSPTIESNLRTTNNNIPKK